jgi:pimeloyl-ACP methyl ester carboxylesterase
MTVDKRLFSLSTSHGTIVVEDSGGSGLPMVMLHGNSTCRGVFARQTRDPVFAGRRIIAFDLPGHGDSADAADPERSYTRPGLTDLVIEVLALLHVREAVVLGWSLGGHIGIQMLSQFPGIAGLIITGTPPIGRGGMSEGFVTSPQRGLASRGSFSRTEAERFARMIFGEPVAPFVLDAIQRTDGRFREVLFGAVRAGEGRDQRSVVESSPVPLAVINGADDPLIKLDYLDSLDYANLWDGRCHRLGGMGHAAFWHAADQFNRLVARFLSDIGR